MNLITRSFPALAVLAALLAYIRPEIFDSFAGLIVPLLTVVMFMMGLNLTLKHFLTVFLQPQKIAVGTILQFLIMPLAAFLISHALSLESELLTGMVLLGCCPGGTASNVICYLARGNLALSISLTMVSTFLSVLATPFLTFLYLGQAVEVPVMDMVLSIAQVVILPVMAGLLINTYQAERLKKYSNIFPAVSVLAIVLIIGIVVALNHDNMALLSGALLVAIILHNLFGFGSAYGLSKLLHYDESSCRTIAIEVGMQNSGLAVALATQFYTSIAALPGALFSLWHNLSGSLLASFWARK